MEIQIFNDDVFNKVAQVASYASKRTHVCVVPDHMAPELIKMGVSPDDIPENVTASSVMGKPLVDYVEDGTKSKVRILDAPAEMLIFAQCRSLHDTRVPPFHIGRTLMMVREGLLEPTVDFSNRFTKMGFRDPVSELFVASANMRVKGKGLMSLNKCVDGMTSNTVQGVLDYTKSHITRSAQRQLPMVITGGEQNEKYFSIYGENEDGGNLVELRFYSATPLIQSLASQKGKRIKVAANKLESLHDQYVLYSPNITPWGLKVVTLDSYRSTTRKIPTQIYNAAVHEFLHRKDLN